MAAAVSLMGAGCANMSPTENALLFGGVAGAVTSGVLAVAGVDPGVALAIGSGTALAVGAGTYLISKQQATSRQRQIALQNARAAEAKMLSQKSKTTTTKSAGKKTAKTPRYIAVDTEKSAQSPTGAKPVMVYDTQSRQLVGNDVYNLKRQPAAGSSQAYDTMTAQYVGHM